MWQFYAVIGLVFGGLAAAIAFILTYEEYSHHQLPRRQLLEQSFHMAGATLLFFMLVLLVILVLSGTLGPAQTRS